MNYRKPGELVGLVHMSPTDGNLFKDGYIGMVVDLWPSRAGMGYLILNSTGTHYCLDRYTINLDLVKTYLEEYEKWAP